MLNIKSKSYNSSKEVIPEIKKCLKCENNFNSYYGLFIFFCLSCQFDSEGGICATCKKKKDMLLCNIGTLQYDICLGCTINQAQRLLSPFNRHIWRKIKY